MLDPIARHDFMATVLTAMADEGVSVVLSSHVLAELERVADYLVLLSRGRVQAGEVEDLLASHRMLTGPAAEADQFGERAVVYVRQAEPGPLAGTRRRGLPRPGGLGVASGRARGTLPGLSARARGGHATSARPGHPAVGSDAMTALTVTARPDEHALRPVPWRRMAWVTWRQHRIAADGVLLFLGAVAVCLWIVGLRLHHAYAVAVACHPSSSPVCDADVTSFAAVGGPLTNGGLLQAVPALIGAFAGAPVLARELESGTFRYAWTPSSAGGAGRWRSWCRSQSWSPPRREPSAS